MNGNTYLLSPPERSARQQEKRERLLRFLREEIWSTPEILGQVLGLRSRQAVWKSLKQFQAEQILRHHVYAALGGEFVVWGITAHGQALAFHPEEEKINATYFEPSKVSEMTIRHSLDIQRLRIAAERQGWREWRNGQNLGAMSKGMNRPDVLALDPTGMKAVLEIERTVKTVRRYRAILGDYLQRIKQREIAKVIWVCPTKDLAHRLTRIIFGLSHVVVHGQRVPIDPNRHHINLHFQDYDSFMNGVVGAVGQKNAQLTTNNER